MKKLLTFSFILFLVYACTKLSEPPIHPSEWTDQNAENSHIEKITVTGNEVCESCHGRDFKGGTSGVSCYQCHAGGPSGHPAYSIWVGTPDSPDFHSEEGEEHCISCHGDDYLGGISGVSCYQCHAGGPSGHPASSIWVDSPEDPNFHGKDDIERCTTCHGADYLGGTSEVSCYTCHAGGPSGHPASSIWVDSPDDPNFHGKEDTERCTTCHGADYLGGTSEVSCYQCHAGGPSGHPATSIWVDSPDNADFHGKEDTERCTTCHGADYLGGTSEVSCYTCHAGGPSGHPASDIWVNSLDDPDFHGKDDIERCTTCHGADYLGGTSEVSCYQCHDGPTGYDCPDFTAPDTHTELQSRDSCEALHMPGFDDPLNNGCTLCHGTDLTGGISEVSCFICHGNKWDD